MSYKDRVPILVNYQGAHDSNFPSFPLGTDYSHNYSDAKGIFLYIYDENAEYAVGLKAFLTDFSIDFTLETKEVESGTSTTTNVKSMGIKYNVAISLPAISVNDARVNTARIDALQNMINKTIKQDATARIQSVEPQYILLSNLINNGKYNKLIDVKEASTIKKYGVLGYITEINAEIEDDMGFFEYNGRLWPKVYNLSFAITVQVGLKDNKKLIDSYVADDTTQKEVTFTRTDGTTGSFNLIVINTSKLSDQEISDGKWPFGVKT